MKVQIEENLFLESDAYNFMLREYVARKDGKEGKPKVNTLGYFGTVSDAVKFLLKRKIKESTATTLQELIIDVQRLEGYIRERLTV